MHNGYTRQGMTGAGRLRVAGRPRWAAAGRDGGQGSSPVGAAAPLALCPRARATEAGGPTRLR